MGYYYFDFKDVEKQGIRGLLTSLLSQICAKSDPCYDILSDLYVGNRGLGGVPRNGVRAASRGDPSPPHGGSVSISGCVSDDPTINFWNPPPSWGHGLVSPYINLGFPIVTKHERKH